MKKILFLNLLLFSLVIFSACSNKSISSSKAKETGSGTETSSNTDKSTEKSEDITTNAEANEKESSNSLVKQNSPLGLTITNPSNKGNFTTGYNWNVIRGLTSTKTSAIEVNGYRLTKYVAGSQSWNYIAATKMQTLTEGDNEYVIKAFDADENVIDETIYHINYQNGHALPNVGTSLNITLLLTLIFTLNLFIRCRKA